MAEWKPSYLGDNKPKYSNTDSPYPTLRSPSSSTRLSATSTASNARTPLLPGESTPAGFGFNVPPYSNSTATSRFSSQTNMSTQPGLAQYSLPADPRNWGSVLSPEFPEADDDLHSPTGVKKVDRGSMNLVSWRGLTNFGCLLILLVGLLTLFLGYPLISHFTKTELSTQGGFNLGGINASGQIPSMPGNWGLIDADTPKSAYTMPAWRTGTSELQLVFSDEFNVDGRTFYPGDDPYWEAVDLHYWATNNLEWYDPEALTTANGSLVITLSKKETHGLDYEGGMMSTWNKFCFTGGYFEASVVLPGANNIVGLWPAVWAMGNLGRAGYGASLQGTWPYSYDACDVGTAPNQTINGQPVAATINGDPYNGDALSYLPGQRLSRCTCPGESHPGPVHSDGTFVGRAAPEIDMFEAQIDASKLVGHVSQSAQWGPFDESYVWFNTSANQIIADSTESYHNTYLGGITQETTSVVTLTNPLNYELSGDQFSIYGFEYKPGFDDGYISWITDNKLAWTLLAPGVGANTAVNISARPISQEPMYLIVNLGISENFGSVDFEHLTFPAHMKVDYVRVYQPKDAINIGCDPTDFPTAKYIETYSDAYSNPNLTTWVDDYKQQWPKNSLVDGC